MKVSYFAGTLCFLVCFCFAFNSADTTPCALRETVYGLVCVCSATYCDYLEPLSPIGDEDFVIVSSSKNGLRFSVKNGNFAKGGIEVPDWGDLSSDDWNLLGPMITMIDRLHNMARSPMTATVDKRSVKIEVNRSEEYQKIVGFGGAFTGSVSYLLEKLPQELENAVYESFYSERGIAYNLMRMSIGGCDFDLEPWAYNEYPENDILLSNFTKLDPRDEKKLEQIERLKNVSNIDKIKIMAAAWSAPKWMKTNNEWTGFGSLKKEYYQTWANYHLKFLELMEAKNMPIWAISTGNEPLNGVIGWFFIKFMSLGWTPGNQAVWVADNLGPTIRNSRFSDLKIFSNDDQRYTFPAWFESMKISRPESLDYLDGLAVHWYWDELVMPSFIDATHKMMPDKMLLSTESCLGDKPGQKHVELGSWERAETYANSYFEDLQHAFNGYIDWNLILDEQGGPNYVNNFVDAPIIVNATSGDEIYKQPIFYAIGHFSKYIPEGSVRIKAERSNVNIKTVAFKRPDEKITAVFLNSGRAPVDVTLADSVRGNIVISIPPHSIHTILYN